MVVYTCVMHEHFARATVRVDADYIYAQDRPYTPRIGKYFRQSLVSTAFVLIVVKEACGWWWWWWWWSFFVVVYL